MQVIAQRNAKDKITIMSLEARTPDEILFLEKLWRSFKNGKVSAKPARANEFTLCFKSTPPSTSKVSLANSGNRTV